MEDLEGVVCAWMLTGTILKSSLGSCFPKVTDSEKLLSEVIVPRVFICSFVFIPSSPSVCIRSLTRSLIAVAHLLCSTHFKMRKMGKAVVLPVLWSSQSCGPPSLVVLPVLWSHGHEQNHVAEVDSQGSETETGYLERAVSAEMVLKLE